MGIKFRCPNGHKLNVKSFLAGKRGICPHCGVGVDIPEANGAPARKHKTASAGSPVLPAPRPVPAPAGLPLGARPVPSAQISTPTHPALATQATVSVQPGAAKPTLAAASHAAQPMPAAPASAAKID